MTRLRICSLILVGVTALLAACGIPDGGPPVEVSVESTENSESEVNVAIPEPPIGGEPVETIAAFFGATGVTQKRSRLAEEFVAPVARGEFLSGKGVQVVRVADGPREDPERRGNRTAIVTMTLAVEAEIDEMGTYTPTSRSVEVELRLVRRADVWLLATPPPSVWVRNTEASKAFRPVLFYFSADEGDSLVPEQRHIDRSIQLDALPTHIVNLLLAGPGAELATIAPPPLPKGTRLRGNVTTVDNVLVLDFTPDIESASAVEINTFLAQVGWSLRRWRPAAIRTLVAGRPIGVAGVKETQQWEDWKPYNPAAVGELQVYGVVNGAVQAIGDDSPVLFGGDASRSGVLSAAVSLDGKGVAVVRTLPDGNQELWIGDAAGDMRPVISGEKISRPTWGRTAQAVLVSVDGVLHRVSRLGVARPLELDENLGRIRAVRLAFDGVRVALVVGEAGATAVYIGALVRDGEADSVSLRVLRRIGTPPPYTVDDVGWLGAATIVVAGREANEQVTVFQMDIDGSSQNPTPALGIRRVTPSIASSPSEPSAAPLYLELDSHLYRRFRDNWGSTTSARAPFYPG